NNLHNYLDDLVDKAVSPVVYLIGVDHIQDVIDSLGYAWADQALLEVVNRFREKLKPDQYLCRIEGTQFVLVSLENDVSNITQIADELRNVVSKPIMIDDKPFPLMVMYPLHGLFLSQKRLVKSKILGAGSSRKLAVS
ncbi:diguanylate cyclase domain-containing protein, partial [Escherichia coli]